MRQVALLRGVNLGKRQVIMSELRALCEAAGFTNVQTLLASGNLVLDAKERGARLEAKLEKLLFEEMGLKTDVFVRTGAELDAIIAANPFKAFAKSQPTFLVAICMRERASVAEMKAMEDTARLGEEIKQGKNCLYIKFPKGQGPSKLKTPKLGTSRNWNTVTKLAAMLAE
jgi:uncharacterized protein (DUF1697 family)